MGGVQFAGPTVRIGDNPGGQETMHVMGRVQSPEFDDAAEWGGFIGHHTETCLRVNGQARQVLVGLGPLVDLNVERLSEAARSAADRLVRHLAPEGPPLHVVTTLVSDSARSVGTDLAVRAVTVGMLLGFQPHQAGRRVTVHLTGLTDVQDQTKTALEEAVAGARAVGLATELIDARANQLTPSALANRAQGLASAYGLEFDCLDERELRERGLTALLAVGAGSQEPSCLVRLAYRPPGTSQAPVALVGKGVTFDSGGLSLKSSTSMVGMHSDMAGAATVLAAMCALAELGSPVPVVAYLPLAENLPGPGATRPGDVVTSLCGKGIEVVDTDFEGRVLMADALTMAAREEPKLLVDIATLTYQAVTALGPEIGAVIGRDAAVAKGLQSAGDEVGEAWWSLPYAIRYAPQVQSSAPGAHVRNHPGADTGRAITAALFLGEFVPDGIPWAHLDMAGPAMRHSGPDAQATGFGVRTLIRFIQQLGTDALPTSKTEES